MDRPPKGYYRQILKGLPNIRIAIANQPMSGVTAVDPSETLRQLDASTDPYAKYYAEKIRDGSFLVITETPTPKTHWAPGELFLRS